jgi:hypothetical protein
MMRKTLVSAAICPLLLTGIPLAQAEAGTLYKCIDDSGVVLYTNQKTTRKNCTVLSVPVPPPASGGTASSAERPKKASTTPTPSDFPRVSSNEQKVRDTDRRAILERELATEQAALEKSRQALAAGGANPAPTLRDAVTLHERNIEALNKELAKVR